MFNSTRAPASVIPRISPITTITANTSSVSWRASGHVGHDTLRSSPVVSRKNDWIGLDFLLLSFSATMSSFALLTAKTPPYIQRRFSHLQARQDLNPQPLVLETSALPIELLAFVKGRVFRTCPSYYFVSRCVVCFLQRGQNLLNSSRFGSFRRFFSVV
jgi:hypothetical protein